MGPLPQTNLQAELDYEGYLPKPLGRRSSPYLGEVREALKVWVRDQGLARKSPTGGYY
ncbi:hypothetical protein [Thermus tengchongensis]|uniref:hypothetical protein n=1 Tax=Thermus tengchongensis TaxID=1214928 RepID=UPI001F32EA0E|nr:hypothetical protein [Thermus tengchongensis]